MYENTHNHKIMIFVKRIFAPDICLQLQSLLKYFVKRGPGPKCRAKTPYNTSKSDNTNEITT